MKLEVNENRECNDDNRLKKYEAEIVVIKPIEERQVESQLKDEDRHLVYTSLSETNVKSSTNKKESRKQIISDTVCGLAISNPIFIRFGSQPEFLNDLAASFRFRITSLVFSNNSQGQSLSTITKEVKNEGVVSGVKVQDTEKQKVNNASSSPTPDGRFSLKLSLTINMAQEQKNHRIYP
ncbi:OLC1v1024475C1 [Oldenlandia corymbosa var. corymbosa]|uniref:OLC1v1024475C1 n=1 Tax=Oldenlandia corymbosa var. corymbosa TaxID=529605 RepID=A0AAV1C2F3_OLDCO|nr:OLC1v1024475C1 [Oldenlandia corymbosa var. corymbosa]